MSTPINPAEALMCAIGVRPIVSHRIERITPEQWKKAATVAEDANDIAGQMARGELDELTVNDFERVDYSETLRGLTTPYVEAQVEAMLAHIPLDIDGLQSQFEALAKKTFDYLYSQFPIALRKSVAGNNNLVPARRLVSRFESLLWVLDNPLGVFNLMQNGTLTAQQLDGLRALYPTLCTHIEEESIPAAIEGERAKNPRFQLSRHTEQGVRRFLGRLPIAPELAAVLQAQPSTKQTGPGAEAKSADPLPRETASRSERIEQGSTRP